MATPKKKSILYRKKILSANVCKKNCAMSAKKYQSGLSTDRCQLVCFVFNPWIIFGWCPLGNVRSESSGHASFWGLDLSSFQAGRRRLAFFFINICVNHVFFLPRRANVFVADKMRTCQCRPKHNPARKTLADLHCTFFRQYRATKLRLPWRNIIGQCL